jgi:hypothetical protein
VRSSARRWRPLRPLCVFVLSLPSAGARTLHGLPTPRIGEGMPWTRGWSGCDLSRRGRRGRTESSRLGEGARAHRSTHAPTPRPDHLSLAHTALFLRKSLSRADKTMKLQHILLLLVALALATAAPGE